MEKKYDWKKEDKALYLPKEEPVLINLPSMNFFVVDGHGDPNNSKDFQDAMQVLYSLSFGIKMMPKSGTTPEGYYQYTVFPLEGVWDMDSNASDFRELDKSKFVYSVMIRQPNFVDKVLASKIIEKTHLKKPELQLNKVRFESIKEGMCVQMMHIGSYDDEPKSFAKMESFCKENNLERISHIHREIYLSDPRKVAPERRRTVLRFQVKHK